MTVVALALAALPVLLVIPFQLYYLLQGLRVAVAQDPPSPALVGLALTDPALAGSPISIVIPARDAAETIGPVLAGILANDLRPVERVVVVLDRCRDATEMLVCAREADFRSAGVLLETVTSPGAGKVAALKEGLGRIATADALLLDSDIILAPTAIAEITAFHWGAGTPFSSALVLPATEAGRRPGLVEHIICNNRLYRQCLLQLVKDRHGAANFPGGLQLVDAAAYQSLLVHGFLEDLTASYVVLARHGRIAILPRIAGFEVERATLAGLFWQRVRWTIGALQHIPAQLAAARRQREAHRWFLINSYHVMWELQHYAIVVGAIAALSGGSALFLVPLVLYALQICRSAHLARRHFPPSPLGVALHIVVFPAIISAALLASLFRLAHERRFIFDSIVMYRRR